ncbi:MAG: hypothetical protein H0V09_05615 [Gemmatimonadetes bacterium]|nr:hypothetical protein [Gemmatimonadota bacterium]
MIPPRRARFRPLAVALPALAALAGAIPAACVRTYDVTIDNRTVTSLTLRVFSPGDDGAFSQYPDRIFELPPNREFKLQRAIVRIGEERRLFEFRRGDEQLVDSFILTYRQIEEMGGRITVPRSLTSIARDAPPEPGYVDSSPHERVEYIPLFPQDPGRARSEDGATAVEGGGDASPEP